MVASICEHLEISRPTDYRYINPELKEAFPELRLGLLYKSENVFGEEGAIAIIIIWVSFGVGTFSD